MLIFEYICKKCGTLFEALVPKADRKASGTVDRSKRADKPFSTIMDSSGYSNGGYPYSLIHIQ